MALNKDIEFDVVVNGKKAQIELNNVEKAQDKLEKSTKRTTETMGKNWLSLGAKVAGYAYAVKGLTEKFAIQEKAERSLNAAMKNNQSLIDKNSSSWIAYASNLQEASNVGDEVILQQLAFLNTLGLTDDQMKKIIETATNLSNAGFMSMDSATKNLAKTLSGMQGELGELFPQLKDLSTEALKAGKGIETIAQAVQGQNEAIANSSIGKWDKLWNDIGDTMEKAGGFLVTILDKLQILNGASWLFKGLQTGFDGLTFRMQSAALHVEKYWNSLAGNDAKVKEIEAQIADVTKAYNELYTKTREEAKKPVELDIVKTATFDMDAELKKVNSQVIKLKDEIRKLYKDGLIDSETLMSGLAGVDSWATEVKKIIEELFTFDEAAIIAKGNLNTIKENAKDTASKIGDYFDDTFTSGLTDALLEGKASFKDFADSMIKDIARIIIQQQIAKSVSGVDLGSIVSGFFAAQGGVIGGESPVQKRFATGGIVNRPTRFANGGMVGERNRAEAILPLERTANGDLGVKAGGGGSNVVVNIENQTGSNIDASDITTSSNQEQETINIVLKGISKNTSGIRDLLKGM